MNIVEKEADNFIDSLFMTGRLGNLGVFRTKIETKLFDFKRDRDKLDFLKILRQLTQTEKENHLVECQKNDCPTLQEFETVLFIIEQEIDVINDNYVFESKSSDSFSPEVETELHSKLNSVIEKLEKLGIGQEIIYEEFESLKSHFNLGKKNWFQLLKGKLLELTLEKIIDETIVKDIYKTLSDSINDMNNLIEK